jgi:hypothetical protein
MEVHPHARSRRSRDWRFEVVEGWLAERRRLWESRLDRFDQYVKQLKEKEPGP